jgi:sulfatase maturation enzyme AslB (radical SAM superfamily)
MNQFKQFWRSIESKFFSKDFLEDLTDKDYLAYNQSRSIREKRYLCHAPFNNLYFNTEGHIAVCWLTFNNPVHYTESKTLMELWKDTKFQSLRAHIKEADLQFQCQTCHKLIKEGNHVNVLAKAYDSDYPLTDFPSIIEFELDNTCNLACTMCNGMLSSTIRKDREKLPPLKSPYGEKFLNELKTFIPHLKEARFNGGEPFLINIYYKIWDLIIELNPKVKMTIATNGTVLNNKVKSYLEKGNFHLNISMDGFSKQTYESTRVNADFERLMKHIEWFNNYCQTNRRNLCIMINPMRQNWWEMPEFVNWCNENKVHLWFNTIVRPENQAIWTLPATELDKIYIALSQAKIKPNPGISNSLYSYNVSTFNNLVNQQIKTWAAEARNREMTIIRTFEDSDSFFQTLVEKLENSTNLKQALAELSQQEKDNAWNASKGRSFVSVLNNVEGKSAIEIRNQIIALSNSSKA